MNQLSIAGTSGEQGSGQSRKATAAGGAALEAAAPAELTEEQRANLHAAAVACGCQLVAQMTFAQADGGAVNPGHGHENCAACVAVYELRRRGLDIAARAYLLTPGSTEELLSNDTRLIWRNSKGLVPEWSTVLSTASTTLAHDLEAATLPVNSRYHLSYDYDKSYFGHILTAERTPLGLVLYDPQINKIPSLAGLSELFKKDDRLRVLRVDRLLIDTELLAHIALAAP